MAKQQQSDVDEFDDDDWKDTEDDGEPKRLTQPSLVADIGMLMCKVYGYKRVVARQFNSIIAAANLIIEEFEKPHQDAPGGCGMRKWWESDDTGLSSKHMARVLWPLADQGKEAGLRLTGPDGHFWDEKPFPSDPSDFKRCVGLLDAVPALRLHLPRMAEESPVWKAYIERWAEMEALLAEELPTGSAQKLFKLMQDIQDAERAAERASDRATATAQGDTPQQ
jgi:hypothetical protein